MQWGEGFKEVNGSNSTDTLNSYIFLFSPADVTLAFVLKFSLSLSLSHANRVWFIGYASCLEHVARKHFCEFSSLGLDDLPI